MSISFRVPISLWLVCFVVPLDVCFSSESPLVRIDTGLVQGMRLSVENEEVDVFYGIPYAQPPVGDLRFSKPRPAKPWNTTFVATELPTPCLQPNFRFFDDIVLNYSTSSEDCLYLNVWRPSRICTDESLPSSSAPCASKLPVVVFLHGGAFQSGDSGLSFYDARNFVATSKTIFVSLNYRVNFFGFLSLGAPALPGNMGLWDQLTALKWIKRNIERFGGNAGDVTLSGHSAGSIAAGMLSISPLGVGLFNRLLMQSGTPLSMIVLLSYRGIGKFVSISASLGCYDLTKDLKSQVYEVIACLRELDASVITSKLSKMNTARQAFLPVYGDTILPYNFFQEGSMKLHVKELLTGTVRDEGTFIVHGFRVAVPYLLDILGLDYRLAVSLGLRLIFDIPIASGKKIVDAYFGDLNTHHDNDTIIEILSEIIGDSVFVCPTNVFAETAAAQGVNVYRYVFAYRSKYSIWPKWTGVAHGSELPFLLGSLRQISEEPRLIVHDVNSSIVQLKYSAEDELFMHQLLGSWTSFVRDGFVSAYTDASINLVVGILCARS